MRPDVTYTHCATYSSKQTGNIITSALFEVVQKMNWNRNDGESDDYDSTIPPLLIKEDIDAVDSGDESKNYLISKEMLEDIHDRSQYHPNVNKRYARYKIRDRISKRQL